MQALHGQSEASWCVSPIGYCLLSWTDSPVYGLLRPLTSYSVMYPILRPGLSRRSLRGLCGAEKTVEAYPATSQGVSVTVGLSRPQSRQLRSKESKYMRGCHCLRLVSMPKEGSQKFWIWRMLAAKIPSLKSGCSMQRILYNPTQPPPKGSAEGQEGHTSLQGDTAERAGPRAEHPGARANPGPRANSGARAIAAPGRLSILKRGTWTSWISSWRMEPYRTCSLATRTACQQVGENSDCEVALYPSARPSLTDFCLL